MPRHTTTGRLTHPDQVRATAILLMVMVHAAATWTPATISRTGILAFAVSGLGGLAAPLFVTLAGWGIARSELTRKKLLVRSGFLFAAQIMVNLCAPHLFQTFTPGILSLLATIIILAPIWLPPIRFRGKTGAPIWIPIFTIIIFLPTLFPEVMGPSEWDYRIETQSFKTATTHLFFTGTYPLIPWISFAILGALIADNQKMAFSTNTHINSTTLVISGSIFFIFTALYASQTNRILALPHGNSLLTFFPANTPFLVCALTGVGIIWQLMKKVPPQRALIDLGQRSLTVYILHFIPFAFFHHLEESGNWSATTCTIIVILYTMIWIPLAYIHAEYIPKYSFENLLRKITR